MTRETQLKRVVESLLQMIEDKICWNKTVDDTAYLADLKMLLKGKSI